MDFQERQMIFEETFEMERQKIPRIMRMTPRKKKALKIIFAAFCVVLMLIIMLFPRWLGATAIYQIDPLTGEPVVVKMIYYGYVAAIVLAALPLLLIVLYLFLGSLFEKQAVRSANDICLGFYAQREAKDHEEDRRIREQYSNLASK